MPQLDMAADGGERSRRDDTGDREAARETGAAVGTAALAWRKNSVSDGAKTKEYAI